MRWRRMTTSHLEVAGPQFVVLSRAGLRADEGHATAPDKPKRGHIIHDVLKGISYTLYHITCMGYHNNRLQATSRLYAGSELLGVHLELKSNSCGTVDSVNAA